MVVRPKRWASGASEEIPFKTADISVITSSPMARTGTRLLGFNALNSADMFPTWARMRSASSPASQRATWGTKEQAPGEYHSLREFSFAIGMVIGSKPVNRNVH